jgi:hypothetical protein
MWQRKHWLIFGMLVIVAAGFRISAAHWLANDNPDDGRVYAQIARDVLEQHVYSQDAESPYEPTLIRTPGYPLFIASVYAVFGHGRNGAVRIVQAVIDTATCLLVAMLAFIWQPDERRKPSTALIALGFAAVNPFTTIYSGTILPEVPTMFLTMAACVTASTALRAERRKRQVIFWIITGLLAGLDVLFRPDLGLLAAAIGLTMLAGLTRTFWSLPAERNGAAAGDESGQVKTKEKRKSARESRPQASPRTRERRLSWTLVTGFVFSLSFVIALLPWTIRNWRAFHLFQPIAPAHAEMPNEFIPHGYHRWLKTWLDDPQYIDPMEWELDVQPINIDDLPDDAFDSDEERDRVAELFDKYNHSQTPATAASTQPSASSNPESSAVPKPLATPNASPLPQSSPQPNKSPSQETQPENDNSSDEGEESEANDKEETDSNAPHGPVEMTPEIDATFAQIATERIHRHPFRYYVLMPLRRARALWFNTHSDFYPFEGTLLPLEDLDYDIHQHIWLPLFALLVAIYTIGGLAGGYALAVTRSNYGRLWLLLITLFVVLRLGFLSTLENPEPRYVVEFFPFLAALSGIGVSYFLKRGSSLDEPDARKS